MELHLQFGDGMMKLSSSLVNEWGGGTVILSPRDLKPAQLSRQSQAINSLPNGAVLVDPQFYLPNADHARLVSHKYWPSSYSTGSFFGGPKLSQLLVDLKDLNDELETSEVILPGLLAQEINDDWLATQAFVLEEAEATSFGRPLLQTIALSADASRTESQIASLLEHSEGFRVDGYYLVFEHPSGSYLVDDAAWLANVIDLIAGLKLKGGRVIVGYCNHQFLLAGIAKADAIASGNWMNVRAFPPEKFRLGDPDEVRRKSNWYYCPQALSEYKIPVLDIAKRVGLLNIMAPQTMNMYVEHLFAGGQPSTLGMLQSDAFKHYLVSLKLQVEESVKGTFDETVAFHEDLLTETETVLTTLRRHHIRGQLRDFSDLIDVGRAAIAATVTTRGPMLRHRWTTL